MGTARVGDGGGRGDLTRGHALATSSRAVASGSLYCYHFFFKKTEKVSTTDNGKFKLSYLLSKAQEMF